jgi:hypothetical protein
MHLHLAWSCFVVENATRRDLAFHMLEIFDIAAGFGEDWPEPESLIPLDWHTGLLLSLIH